MLTSEVQVSAIQTVQVAALRSCLKVSLQTCKGWHTVFKSLLQRSAFLSAATGKLTDQHVAPTVKRGVDKGLC